MLRLWWLKETVQRRPQRRRCAGPRIRHTDAGAPLRCGDQEVRPIEAESEVHGEPIRPPNPVLCVERPLAAVRLIGKTERIGDSEFGRAFANPGGFRLLRIRHCETEVLPQREMPNFESELEGVAP